MEYEARKQLSGNEVIDDSQQILVSDFWKWAYSDILDNRNRAIFGEFIVACALNTTSSSRIEWDETDIRYNGYNIEVKTSAYLQSWQQKTDSQIKYDIGKKKGWNAATNEFAIEAGRCADIYVFCLLSERDRKKIDPINLKLWDFYIVSKSLIEEKFENQKTIQLSSLAKLSTPTKYENIKSEVDKIITP